jgi:transposase
LGCATSPEVKHSHFLAPAWPTGLVPKKKSLAATERNEQAREEFITNQASLEADQLVVLDECGTHTSLTLTHGWSRRGQRVCGSVPRNRGKNLTLIGALTTTWALSAETCMVLEGATDRLAFEAYIEKVLAPHLKSGQTVIMDNLSAHKSAKVKQIIAAKGCKVLFLPAYSPDLSPIELAFSKLKGHLRRIGARSREALESAIGQSVELITPQDALGYFRHCGYS